MPAEVIVNEERIDLGRYLPFHKTRIDVTLEMLRKAGTKRLVELGGHPWAMTSAILDAGIHLEASVSAEEVTNWPDEIPITRRNYVMKTIGGLTSTFPNYSANLERSLFQIEEKPDTVIACEILEHLVRSPHIMFLNINRWLPSNGTLFLTTPNGTQFSNPFRVKPARPAYRCNAYARHNGLVTLDQLVDITELSGFKVRESGFLDVYPRRGISLLYSALSRLPFHYCHQKFKRTIYVLATKERDVKELPRLPKCYSPSRNWEYISHNGIAKRQAVELDVE